MTLVLGTPWGVFTDQMISSSDGVKCDPIRKCASNIALAAGFAGSYQGILKATEAVTLGETDPKALLKFKVDGIIVRNGRIMLIDSGRLTTRRASCKFYCTGTGYAEATAFMSGLLAAGKSVTHQNIEKCFKYVFRVRTDCGGKIDFLPG